MLDVFAKRLKTLRLSRRLTLQKIGDAVGSNLQTISNFENVRKSPSLKMILALAEFFDVSVDYLVGHSDDPARTRTGDGIGETVVWESAQSPEREKLIGMIQDLHEDDTSKAMSYVAFLRQTRRREDWKKRRAESKDERPV